MVQDESNASGTASYENKCISIIDFKRKLYTLNDLVIFYFYFFVKETLWCIKNSENLINFLLYVLFTF